MPKDYYKILGIDKNASPEEIKKAYRKLAHQHHPDKKGGDEAKFKELNEAYQILSDEKKRAQYDQFGTNFDSGFSGFDGQNFGDLFEWLKQSGFRGGNFDFDSSFGDLFRDFFGGARQKTTYADFSRGEDLNINLTIDFEQAIKGDEIALELYKKVECGKCYGSGAEGLKMKNCNICNGKGEVKESSYSFFGTLTRISTCSYCFGLGKQPEKTCGECNGEGRVKKLKKIDVVIPAGVSSGETIVLRNQGVAGLRQAKPGDLYITVHVKPHKLLKRVKNDVVTELPLNFSEAVLGKKVEISTVYGKEFIEVFAGIQSGDEVRLKGKGVKGKGDHVVIIKVATPRNLTKNQKDLIKELQKEGI